MFQAITLETYPAELSLTAWICLMGTLEGGVVALVMERGNAAVWSLNLDTKLLAAVYSVRKIFRGFIFNRLPFIQFSNHHGLSTCTKLLNLTMCWIQYAGCLLFRTRLLCARNNNERQRTCFCDGIQSTKHDHRCYPRIHYLSRKNVPGKVSPNSLFSHT